MRGIRTKTNELFLKLSACEYDVIVLTETWLRPDVASAEFAANYSVFRCDRSAASSTLQRGGGVLIAVKASLSCSSVELVDCGNIEQVAVRVNLCKTKIYVCGIYLRPNSPPALYSTHEAAVHQICERAMDSDRIVIVGDYNLPQLVWSYDEDVNSLLPSNASTEQEIALVESMVASGLHQLNSLLNSNGRTLDLAFVNEPNDVELIEPPSALLRIDNHHKPFVLRIDVNDSYMELSSDNNVDDFDFRRCSFPELNNAILNVNWTEMFQAADTDETVRMFYEKLYDILEELVPRRRRRTYSFKHPWWTSELQHLRNVLRKARKRYFRARSAENRVHLHSLEAQYSDCQDAAFHNYIRRMEQTAKQDPSSFWSFIRSRKQSNRIPAEMTFKDSSANSPHELANLFADFFEEVHSTTSPTFSPDSVRNCPIYNLNCPPLVVSQNDVLLALEKLDVSKGPGTDNIPPLFLRECADSLLTPLTIIFNKSLSESTFPEAWKSASITPIFKAGNNRAVENYRGVSILCCLAKVFEQLVHEVLYAASRPLISDFQHGFVKRRSTTTNLMSYVSFLSSEIENRHQVDAIYFDFSKAFDRVPHDLAIAKFKHLGFPDWITEWLRSYLSSRRAFVKVNGARSRVFSITSGVPQGSVLGPLIFILFVNDVCLRLKSRLLLFADDMKIYRVISSHLDCCALQADIDELLLWCSENGMELNYSKCKFISFSRRQSRIEFEYSINSETMERVQAIRDLGVVVDSKLRFNEHVSTTTAKAFAALGFIRRNTNSFTDIYALKTLYSSIVRSIMEYAVTVWSPYHAVQTIRMERIQRSFIRYALRQLPWNDPANLPDYASRCMLIDLETLSARRTKLQRLFIFDLVKGNIDCPPLLQNLGFYAPSRQLRERNLFLVRRHRTTYGYNNPFDNCVRSFNNVSAVFDFNLSKSVFKSRIRNLG